MRLGDKAIVNGGGVDTSTPVTPPVHEESASVQEGTESEAAPEPAQVRHDRGTGDAAKARALRPRDKLKRPGKFKN